MKINFSINNQKLTRTDNQEIIADSKNYLIANFSLQNSVWKENIIYILFTYEDKTYKKILGAEEGCGPNECKVPFEVIHSPRFSVSAYAGDRVTTNSVKVIVSPSGYTEDIANEDLTPSILEQTNMLLNKYARLCNNILQECNKVREEIVNG